MGKSLIDRAIEACYELAEAAREGDAKATEAAETTLLDAARQLPNRRKVRGVFSTAPKKGPTTGDTHHTPRGKGGTHSASSDPLLQG